MNFETYSQVKKLPLKFLKELGLGSDGNALVTPYFAFDGSLFRERFRKEKEWWWGVGRDILPYGLWRLNGDQGLYLVLCEGESDTQTLWYHGIRALGIPGAQTFKSEWVRYLKDYPEVFLVQENDEGGERFVRDTTKKLREGGYEGTVKILKLPENSKDVNDLYHHCQSSEKFKAVFTGLVAEATEVKPSSPFALGLSQFMNGPKKINWIVDELIASESLTMLASKPKLGKTLKTFNLAITLARGEDFLGRKTKKINVLIIQLEDPTVLIRNRFDKMNAYGLDGIFIRAGLPMNEADWEILPQFIKENDIGLTIIDPLVFAMYGDENDATKVSIFLKELRNLIFKTGCSILLVHHHRKTPGEYGDQIRGSSAILGAVDVALELIRENEQTPTATLKVTSRFASLEDEVIKLDVNTLTWKSEGNADGYKQRKREDAIFEALNEGQADIESLEASLNLTKPAFYNDLKRLVTAGLIDETRERTGGRGQPKFVYSLAQNQRLQKYQNHGVGYRNNTHSNQEKEARNDYCNSNSTLGLEKSYRIKEPVENNPENCPSCNRKIGPNGFPENDGNVDFCLECWNRGASQKKQDKTIEK